MDPVTRKIVSMFLRAFEFSITDVDCRQKSDTLQASSMRPSGSLYDFCAQSSIIDSFLNFIYNAATTSITSRIINHKSSCIEEIRECKMNSKVCDTTNQGRKLLFSCIL